MTEQELEQVIQGYLLDIYKAKYIGKLKVKKLLPFGYQVSLGMNTPECPYIIYAELYIRLSKRNCIKRRIRYAKFNRCLQVRYKIQIKL